MTSRVAVITGAAGGIGAATVDLFRSEGWFVVGIDLEGRTATNADRSIAADLADEEDVRAAFESIADLGHVHALVNTAAILQSISLLDTTPAEWDQVLAVNLRGAFLATQCAHPLMKERGGAVVNVSSVHAVATTAGAAPYAASKAGLVALTRSSALELAADGIRVNAVLPGAVDTGMLRREGEESEESEHVRSLADRTPLGRIAAPREIAQVILFLADGERSSFVTGATLVADGGALARLSTE
jgi:NAD(P)-dependent dehydrogenase (short-subunit alcohol dehydrogenase family)